MYAEGNAAIVDVVRQCVSDHGKYHDDVLAGLTHREERDHVIGEILPSHTLEQYPADAQLQGQAHEKSADKEKQLTSEVVLGLEYPVAVPQKTVDDTQNVTSNIGDTVRQSESGIEKIECDKGDERI